MLKIRTLALDRTIELLDIEAARKKEEAALAKAQKAATCRFSQWSNHAATNYVLFCRYRWIG